MWIWWGFWVGSDSEMNGDFGGFWLWNEWGWWGFTARLKQSECRRDLGIHTVQCISPRALLWVSVVIYGLIITRLSLPKSQVLVGNTTRKHTNTHSRVCALIIVIIRCRYILYLLWHSPNFGQTLKQNHMNQDRSASRKCYVHCVWKNVIWPLYK